MAIGLHRFPPFIPKESRSPMFGIKQIPSLFRLAGTQGSVGLTAAWSVAPQRRAGLAAEDQVTGKPAAVAGEECTRGVRHQRRDWRRRVLEPDGLSPRHRRDRLVSPGTRDRRGPDALWRRARR